MALEKRYYGITIDGLNSLDIDDAIWCEKVEDGNFLVTIYVTAASEFVTVGSEMDRHALALGASRYNHTGAFEPMIPRNISELNASLIPNYNRSTLAVRLLFDGRTLDLINSRISLLPFRSLGRYTFQEAAVFAIATDRREISEWDKEKQIFPPLGKIAERLAKKRRLAGAVCQTAVSEGWAITDEMQLIKLDLTERNLGYLIVQEFSILASRVMSEAALKNNIPVIFRNHNFIEIEDGVEEKSFRKYLAAEAKHYIETARNITPRSLATVFKHLQAGITPGPAFYSAENIGHAGLAVPTYGNYTSPLRRYSDLVNQRQFTAFLGGTPLPYDLSDLQHIAGHLNELARKNREEKSEGIRRTYQDKRVKVIKKAENPQNRDEIVLNVSELSDGEFFKTGEAWLNRIDEKKSNANGDWVLFEAVKKKITQNSFQPKMAVLFLTRGMREAPARAAEMCLPENKAVAAIVSLVGDWIIAKPEEALQMWNLVEMLYPGSLWRVPKFETVKKSNYFESVSSLTMLGGETLEATGRGTQKQEARKQAAVNLWLKLIGEKPEERNPPKDFNALLPPDSDYCDTVDLADVFRALKPKFDEGNFKTALSNFSSRAGEDLPDFRSSQRKTQKRPFFDAEVQMNFSDELLTGSGSGSSKKKAEQEAARGLLEKIAEKLAIEEFKENYPPSKIDLSQSVEEIDEIEKSCIIELPEVQQNNYIGALQTFFQRINQKPPVYFGQQKINTDICSWQINARAVYFDQELVTTGNGQTIMQAKQNAAAFLYEQLNKQIFNR